MTDSKSPISLEKYDVMWVRALWFYAVQSIISYDNEKKTLTFVAKHRFLPFVKHYSVQLVDGTLFEEKKGDLLSEDNFVNTTDSIFTLNGFFWIGKQSTNDTSSKYYSKIAIKNIHFFLEENFALLTLSKEKIALIRKKKHILTYYGNY